MLSYRRLVACVLRHLAAPRQSVAFGAKLIGDPRLLNRIYEDTALQERSSLRS